MKNLLISIKPKFVKEIQEGRKIFEYRKVLPKDNCDFLYIYSSYPVKKIVAKCKYSIITMDTADLWEKTKDKSGITRDFYYDYFRGRFNAGCLELKDIEFFDQPLELSDLGIKYPPQNYMYL